jgi:hypothetical protein
MKEVIFKYADLTASKRKTEIVVRKTKTYQRYYQRL